MMHLMQGYFLCCIVFKGEIKQGKPPATINKYVWNRYNLHRPKSPTFNFLACAALMRCDVTKGQTKDRAKA